MKREDHCDFRDRFLIIVLILISMPMFLRAWAEATGEDKQDYYKSEPNHNINRHIYKITVTAFGRATGTIDAPQFVEVISRNQINQRNISTIPDALTDSTGILIQKTNLGGGSPFIRGLTGKQVLIMVDGVRMNNSIFRYGPNQYLNNIGLDAVSSLEVVRGPGSVLYGSDALGGVINILSRDKGSFGDQPINAHILSRYNSATNEASGALSLFGHSGNWRYDIGGAYSDFDDLRGGRNTGIQEHTGYSQFFGSAKLIYSPDNLTDITFRYTHLRQHKVPRTDKFVLNDEAFYYDPQLWSSAYLRLKRSFEDSIFDWFETTISHNRSLEGRTRRASQSDIRRMEKDDMETWGFVFRVSSDLLANHSLLYGCEYYSDFLSSSRYDRDLSSGDIEQGTSPYPDKSKYRSLGLFLQDEIQLTTAFKLLPGLRYSYIATDIPFGEPFGTFSDSYESFIGSIMAQHRLSHFERFNLIISQGFRAPNLEDTAVLKAETFGMDVPSLGLKPERSTNYEIGFKSRRSSHWLNTSFFYADYTDMIKRVNGTYNGLDYWDENGNGEQDPNELPVLQRKNTGRAYIWGFEMQGGLWLTELLGNHLSISAGYSYYLGHDETDDEPLRRIPPQQGRLELRWQKPDDLYLIDLVVRFADKQDRLSDGDIDDGRIPEGGTPGWTTYNLYFGLKPKQNLKINIGVENITDKDYRIHGSGINAPGRSISIGFSLQV